MQAKEKMISEDQLIYAPTVYIGLQVAISAWTQQPLWLNLVAPYLILTLCFFYRPFRESVTSNLIFVVLTFLSASLFSVIPYLLGIWFEGLVLGGIGYLIAIIFSFISFKMFFRSTILTNLGWKIT